MTSHVRQRTINLMTAVSAITSPLPAAERRAGIARTAAACTLAAVALGLLAATVVLTLLDSVKSS